LLPFDPAPTSSGCILLSFLSIVGINEQDIFYIFINNTIYILLQFNVLKHQLSTQRYELSTTAHVVRKILTAMVAFGTTIPNRSSIIMLFGRFRCLDFWIKDILLYNNT
jgi:hypothetical protein